MTEYTDEICKGVCHYHEDRDKLIGVIEKEINDSIGPKLNQHSGYWKFFFWAAGISLTILVSMTYSMRETVNDMSRAVSEISKTVAVGNEQHKNNVDRLDNCGDNLRDLDNRLRMVEREVE